MRWRTHRGASESCPSRPWVAEAVCVKSVHGLASRNHPVIGVTVIPRFCTEDGRRVDEMTGLTRPTPGYASRMLRNFLACCRFGMALASVAISASAAEGVMITADSAADVKVQLDGVPGELPGAWSALNTVISGKRAGKASAQVALAYDDENLYVAMRIEDSKIVRTAAAGSGVALSAFWNGHGLNPLSSHHPNLRVWPACIQRYGIFCRINGNRKS